jgi:hypothetical protein
MPTHRPIYSHPHYYSAHPHGVCLANGDIVVVFNRAPRRDIILHPPQDPTFENVVTRSTDGGKTWTEPVVAPGYLWSGVECAGLTAMRSRRVLLNQWRFRWYPLPLARKRAGVETVALPAELVESLAASPELDSGRRLRAAPERFLPWGRGPGQTFVHLSEDGGQIFTETVEIAVAPFSGGYGMRGAVELSDGTLVMPLADVPDYQRIFVVHSADGGRSWTKPILVADLPGHLFEEPAPLVVGSGRILMALRENRRHTIFTVYSDDGGHTWSVPMPTGIDGYPAHLVAIDDGRILCTYGFRRPPFAIRAVISADEGGSWSTDIVIDVREPLPNKDLGYPFTLNLGDHLLTVYYAEDMAGTTGIWASEWCLSV